MVRTPCSGASPVCAVNLCLSKAEPNEPAAQRLSADRAQQVIDRLLSDRGASFNRWFSPGKSSARSEAFGRPLSPYLAFRATLKRLAGRERSASRS